MVIDKTKFLFLVGAIGVASAASTGCKVKGSGDEGSGGNDPTTTSASANGGAGGATSTSEGTGGDGGSTSTSEGTGGDGGSTSTSEGTGGSAACLDEEGDGDTCDNACESVTPCVSEGFVKPGVFEDVVPCYQALEPVVCTQLQAIDCLSESLGRACADPSADELAAELAVACQQSEAEVHAVIDGLNAAGRTRVMEDALGFCDGEDYFIETTIADLFY